MTQTLPYRQTGTVARGQEHALFAQGALGWLGP